MWHPWSEMPVRWLFLSLQKKRLVSPAQDHKGSVFVADAQRRFGILFFFSHELVPCLCCMLLMALR